MNGSNTKQKTKMRNRKSFVKEGFQAMLENEDIMDTQDIDDMFNIF